MHIDTEPCAAGGFKGLRINLKITFKKMNERTSISIFKYMSNSDVYVNDAMQKYRICAGGCDGVYPCRCLKVNI